MELSPSLIMLACGNGDSFHNGSGYFVYSVIVDGVSIDYPTVAKMQEIALIERNAPIVCVVWPCPSCRRRGVRGETNNFLVASFEQEDESL